MTQHDDCYYCGGKVTDKRVLKPCLWGDKLIAIIENVPAGVCEQCGEKYYQVEVLKELENILKDRKNFQKIEIPLATYK